EHDEKKITEAISKIGSTTYDYGPRTPVSDVSQIDPDRVIQASELYLNRTFTESDTPLGTMDSFRKMLAEHSTLARQAALDIVRRLTELFKKTGHVILEDGFSYPHIKSPVIRSHQLIIVHKSAGSTDRNYNGDAGTVHYQIIPLVP